MDPDPFSLPSILLTLRYSTFSAFSLFYAALALLGLLVLAGLALAENYLAQIDPEELERLEEEEPNTFKRLAACYQESNRLGIVFIVARLMVAVIVLVSLYFLLSPFYFGFWSTILLLFGLLSLFAWVLPLLLFEYSLLKMKWAFRLSFPFLRISVPLANEIAREKKVVSAEDMSLEDLETVLPRGEFEHGRPSIANLNLYKQVLRFDKIKIRHVMRPMRDLEGINVNYNFKEVIKRINSSTYSRLPVYEGSWTKIHGIIHCKDLLPHTDKEQLEWKKLIRPVIYVQARDNAQTVLRKFQQTKNHMALVLSTTKRLVGLVTLEDITEEIIGEIDDE